MYQNFMLILEIAELPLAYECLNVSFPERNFYAYILRILYFVLICYQLKNET